MRIRWSGLAAGRMRRSRCMAPSGTAREQRDRAEPALDLILRLRTDLQRRIISCIFRWMSRRCFWRRQMQIIREISWIWEGPTWSAAYPLRYICSMEDPMEEAYMTGSMRMRPTFPILLTGRSWQRNGLGCKDFNAHCSDSGRLTCEKLPCIPFSRDILSKALWLEA